VLVLLEVFMTNEKLTLASPVVVKALTVACVAEGEARKKWQSAASQVYTVGIRYPQLVEKNEAFDKSVYETIEQIVTLAQPASSVALLTAKSKIGFTVEQLKDRKHAVAAVAVCMGRITEYLRRFEDTERGAVTRKTFGESLAAKCQDMTDQIRKHKEDDIDFDAIDALALLKELKACFLK
jgi:hypothetical protein